MAAEASNEHDYSKLTSKSKSARERASNITSIIPSERSVPYEEFSHITAKYKKLLNEHTILLKENAEYQRALGLLEQKCRDVQMGILQWKETAEYWIQKCSSLQKIGSEVAFMLADIDKIPSDPRNVSVSFSNPVGDPVTVAEQHVQLTNHNRNTVPSSSQTTEVPDEDQERVGGRQRAQLVPLNSAEDDVPVIVKSRYLKRKRNSAPENLGQAQEAQFMNGDNISREVKCEIASSPALYLQRPNLITQESTFDLDELGEKIKTPRKISTAGLGFGKGNDSQVLSENSLQSSTPNISSNRTVNALSTWPVLKTSELRAKEENVPKSENYISPQGGMDLKGKIVLLSDNTYRPTTPTYRAKPTHNILRQLSPNIDGSLSRKGILQIKPILKRHKVEEDDTPAHPNQTCIILKRSSSEKENSQNESKSRKRLAAMLELAPQKKIILKPEPTSTSRKAKSTSICAGNQANPHDYSSDPKPDTSEGSVHKGNDNVKAAVRRKSERLSKVANTSTSGVKSLSKASQDGPNRLRDKPLEQLNLADFRINSKVNQGCDHAFSEVVRGRDIRSCLSGCTKMDCCGRTFQKVIEVAGIPKPIAKRQSLWDATQQDHGGEPSVAEETRLLRWFLGEDANIDSLSEEDRKKELLSAKTKAFADQHGKHRHAFERSSTPPGFWRTDMPSTQEYECDRGNAKKTELEKKEERYREAMKPEGKWRFRDEC